MTPSRPGDCSSAISAMSTTPGVLLQPSLLRQTTHEDPGVPPIYGSTRFVLWSCFLTMLMTFTPPWREEGVVGGVFDAVAICKMLVRAMTFFGMAFLIARRLSSPHSKLVLRFLRPWFLFALWAVVSTLWSPLKSISLGQSASFFILIMLATGVALTSDRSQFEHLIKGLILSLATLCVLILAIYFILPEWGSLSRARTGLLHATNASATASIGFVVLFAARLLYGWNWTRKYFFPTAIVFAAVLLLAQSRTALAVTILVSSGLSVVLSPPLWRALGMMVVGIGSVLYLAIDLEVNTTEFVLGELSTYLARGQTAQQMAELSGREEMWTAQWNSFLKSPWIGHGYFVSSSKGELYVWYYWGNWTAHNFWLQVLVSTGIVGFCLMLWGLAQYFFGIVLEVIRGRCEWQMAVMIGALMVWQQGWGVNNESFAGPLQPECVVFMVLLGITAARIATGPEQGAKSAK